MKRILAAGATTLLLAVGAAGTAVADPSTAPGPGACIGPPGQPGDFGISLVAFAKDFLGVPPGQLVSFCNLHGHGQNHGGGGF